MIICFPLERKSAHWIMPGHDYTHGLCCLVVASAVCETGLFLPDTNAFHCSAPRWTMCMQRLRSDLRNSNFFCVSTCWSCWNRVVSAGESDKLHKSHHSLRPEAPRHLRSQRPVWEREHDAGPVDAARARQHGESETVSQWYWDAVFPCVWSTPSAPHPTHPSVGGGDPLVSLALFSFPHSEMKLKLCVWPVYVPIHRENTQTTEFLITTPPLPSPLLNWTFVEKA